MNDEDVDELGPVDYVVVEFPADRANLSGEMASELSPRIRRPPQHLAWTHDPGLCS